MMDTRKQKAEKASEMPTKRSLLDRGEHADRIVGSPSWWSSTNYNRSMPQDLKLLQIGSSQLPPPFRGLHSPGVRKHCQIIFACYFRKSSICTMFLISYYFLFFFLFKNACSHPRFIFLFFSTKSRFVSWFLHLIFFSV